MLWSEGIPRVRAIDEAGRATTVTVIAGALPGQATAPPPPPPESWASREEAEVAIWCIHMEPDATWTLPPTAREDTVRTLYFFKGPSLGIGHQRLDAHAAAVVRADAPVELRAGADTCEVLVLQGRPIGEPVVQHGPFVMNTYEEMVAAVRDYQSGRLAA